MHARPATFLRVASPLVARPWLRSACIVATGLMAIGLGGCSSTKGQQPGAQSPERQSDAEYDIARDLFQKGNARLALDHVQKATSLNEENDKAHYLKAAILLSFCSGPLGFDVPDCKLGQVEASARNALKYNADFRDAKNLLGQVLINEKKYREAIAVLDPLTKDPAYVHPYFAWGNLGWAQVLDGQLDAGITSLRNAITEPRFCVGHYRLGVAFEKKGDAGMAEQSFTSAVTADPQCAELQDAWEARARIRVKLGKAPEARQDYERCVEISKETPTGKICTRELGKLAPSPAAPAASHAGGALAPQSSSSESLEGAGSRECSRTLPSAGCRSAPSRFVAAPRVAAVRVVGAPRGAGQLFASLGPSLKTLPSSSNRTTLLSSKASVHRPSEVNLNETRKQ